VSGLRRDLGTIESYAALLGILIGAGIFKVTSDAWVLTGPSVILGYFVLAGAVLAASVPYSVFLSTPLGREPGGEYTHISRTFGGKGLAFVGVWLKIISYIGALAYLAKVFADYVVELFGWTASGEATMAIAVGSLLFFYAVHVAGVRWFGRVQVWMCVLLGVSIVILVVPGFFAIHPANYRPFFTHGLSGFAAALPPLFFAYAGFESLAQTAGEVRDSTGRLPRIFLKGIIATTVIFLSMSVVAFGVLPGERLRLSAVPMAEVGARYLPFGAASFVTLGAVMALTTSVNATFLVPSRVALMLAEDGLAPRWLGRISPRFGTPVNGLTVTLVIALALLLSGRVSLALNIAVFALVILYFLHSLALLVLPRRNPELYRSATLALSPTMQKLAAITAMITMGALIVLQVTTDIRDRLRGGPLTTLELTLVWGSLGAVLYAVTSPRTHPHRTYS
jgi:amino acid transporter